MYTWLNPNRRDRRHRKHEQVEPFLNKEQVGFAEAAFKAREQEDEETRRMLELREMDTAVRTIKPIIEKYVQSGEGESFTRYLNKTAPSDGGEFRAIR